MSDPQSTPVPPAAPASTPQGVPPAGPDAASQPLTPPTPVAPEPPRRSKAWIWWTLGIVVLLAAIIASCAIPVLMGHDGGSFMGGARLGDSIAVIRLDRAIAGTGNPASIMTPEDFYDQLSQAEDDPLVRAVVIRIDSPGGTVAASEEIATYVEQCRKPVYASVGDIGASGAYMVASQCDEIWAMPGSAVGSIGVISQIPNVSELLDNVGIEFQVITAGKYKDAGSPYRPLTKEERALIQGEVDEAYEQFISIVAKGRDMPRSKVEELATGWVWSGDQAKSLGLIDKVGTYEQAKAAAAKAGGIDGDFSEVSYEDEFGTLIEQLMGLNTSLKGLGDAAAGLRGDARGALPR